MVKPRRIGWQVLPGEGSWLPGGHTCFLSRKSSSPWSFFCTGARASHATHQLSHSPSLAGALWMPGRGTPQLCPPWSGAPRCEVPWYRSLKTQTALSFPLLMLKLRARPEVKNKNQKQSSWTALIPNHPLPPSTSLCYTQPFSTAAATCLTMAVLAWRGNFWWIPLCSLASSTIILCWSYFDFHCYSQILKYWDLYGLLFSDTPCLDLAVFWSS